MEENVELLSVGAQGVPEIERRATVISPYSKDAGQCSERLPLLHCLWRLIGLCCPRARRRQQLRYLCGFLICMVPAGLLGGFYVPVHIIKALADKLKEENATVGQNLGFFIVAGMCFILISSLQGVANYMSVRLMVLCRRCLVDHLHALYLAGKGRSYYVMSNLDNRIDNPDQRISNDVDLALQFLFEFFLGGIMDPRSGILVNVILVIGYVSVIFSFSEDVTQDKYAGLKGATYCLSFFAVLQPLSRTLALAVSKFQEEQQHQESMFRVAHTRARTFSESICFYQGHETEHQLLTRRFNLVLQNLLRLTLWKWPFDFVQIFLFFGGQGVAAVVAGWLLSGLGYDEKGKKQRDGAFFSLFDVQCDLMMTITLITMQGLDLAKGHAFASRIVKLVEVMEAFAAFESNLEEYPSGGLCASVQSGALTIQCGNLVEGEVGRGLGLFHCDIFTPDGGRLLIPRVSLKLEPEQSCLIMGPSGCGKSSLLRVLGKLWPLFRAPDDLAQQARFVRPDPCNVFFLAQRPYLFNGTLRQQIAYPLWSESLLEQLSDEIVEDLFKKCNLSDMWAARKSQLDDAGIIWENVLSLGEQQRLQFCRLFWHFQWHRAHGNTQQGFFAILDEATASMDVESEIVVYRQCAQHGFGFLSVAHRPTVIQFHTNVLLLSFGESGTDLQGSLIDGAEHARAVATHIGSQSNPHNSVNQDCEAVLCDLPGSKSPPQVASPYSAEAEEDLENPGALRTALRLIWLCSSPLLSEATVWYSYSHWYWFLLILLTCVAGALLNGLFGTTLDLFIDYIQDRRLFMGACLMIGSTALEALLKSTSNFAAMRLMLIWRRRLVTSIHEAYMSPVGRSYYVLNNLDQRLDSVDQRVTNDVDLLMQFFFEYFFGGVMKVTSGSLYFLLSFFMTCYFTFSKVEKHRSGFGLVIPVAALIYFAVTVPIGQMLSNRVSRVQEKQQQVEANFRVVHTKLRTFSESVCFYGGEASELRSLEDAFGPVWKNFDVFAQRKLPLDIAQLIFYNFVKGYALAISAVLAFGVTNGRTRFFAVVNAGLKQQTQNLTQFIMALLNFSKASAFNKRVLKLLEVMEELQYVEHQRRTSRDAVRSSPWCCGLRYNLRVLPLAQLVPENPGQSVEFVACDIYTPNGIRLLMRNVTFSLKHGESCLIMGPSGIGKSSILRVLGKLWPLFRSPLDTEGKARMVRPGSRNIFFLAQRPYVFEGTLREQIAYPIWHTQLLSALTDDAVERLFREASLGHLWEQVKGKLDTPGVDWGDVLSLGEQQRLQFCRLFWHHEFCESESFFAILDESSASMDVESEADVYRACVRRGFGYLSVAHRPTVIQHHSRVLQFLFKEKTLHYKLRSGPAMASQVAEQLISELPE